MTRKAGKHNHTVVSHPSIVEEPLASQRSRIRAIGNSKGIILNSQVIEAAGLDPDGEMMVAAGKGVIYIVELKQAEIHSDLATWDQQFKKATRNGAAPEGDLYEGLKNDVFEKE